MAQVTDSSLESKSSDELREMLEQTSDEGVVETPQAEVVTETPKEEAQETPKETPQEEKPQEETEEAKLKRGRSYRIKVGGREIQVPLDKLKALAQQGYDYSEKMHQLKQEKEQLRQYRDTGTPQPQNPFGNIAPEKINEFLQGELARDTAGTLFNLINMGVEQRAEKERQERTRDREFERDNSGRYGDMWGELRPLYKDYREDGMTREEALAKAEAEFYKQALLSVSEAAMEEGAKKASAKLKAEMPTGGKAPSQELTGLPSDRELSSMNSNEILKRVFKGKITRTPGW